MSKLILDSESDIKTPEVLVIYRGDWADEIIVEGALVRSREDWEETKQELKEYFSKGKKKDKRKRVVVHVVGSNESICYESYERWESDYSVYSLPYSEETISVLKAVCWELCHQFFIPEWDEDKNDD